MARKPKKLPISEEELLDLVEGNLSAERELELEPVLRANPDLAARVKALAHDRRILRMGAQTQFTAPPGLLAGAMSQAEHEAVVAAAGGAMPMKKSGSSGVAKIAGGLAAGVVIALGVGIAVKFLIAERAMVADQLVVVEAEPVSVLESGQSDPEITEDVLALAALADESSDPIELAVADVPEMAQAVAPLPIDEPVKLGNLGLSEGAISRAIRLAQAGELQLVVTKREAPLSIMAFESGSILRDASARRMRSPFAVMLAGEVVSGMAGVVGDTTSMIVSELSTGEYTLEAVVGNGDALRTLISRLEREGHSVRIEIGRASCRERV